MNRKSAPSPSPIKFPLKPTFNSRKVIRILYLPKSSPSEPPLHTIPRPSRRQGSIELYHLYERVRTVALTPYHPIAGKSKPKRSTLPLDNFSQSVLVRSGAPGVVLSPPPNLPSNLFLVVASASTMLRIRPADTVHTGLIIPRGPRPCTPPHEKYPHPACSKVEHMEKGVS